MKYSEADFKEMVRNLHMWHRQDMGCDLVSKEVHELLLKMKQQRLHEMLRRRLGHYRDDDFCGFVKCFESDPFGQIPIEKAQEVKRVGRPRKVQENTN